MVMKALLNAPNIIAYSDVNPDVIDESPFELVFNADAIKKSLETIFLTQYGSRPFRRQFGSRVTELLYEPVDSTTANRLSIMLREVTNLWEQRISNVKINVIPDYQNQQYYVEMSYSIPGLGNKMVNFKFNISK